MSDSTVETQSFVIHVCRHETGHCDRVNDASSLIFLTKMFAKASGECAKRDS
jgi:hypothetical protein